MNLKFRLGLHVAGFAEPGTGKRGGQIRRGKLTAGLLLMSVVALMTVGCGGSSSSSSSTTTSDTGALYTFFSDAPACDVVAFSMFPTELDLHEAGQPSSYKVTVWPTNIALTSPTIEMATLRDTMTVGNVTSIAPGTYDQAILTVLVDLADIFDPSQPNLISNLTTSATSGTVTVPLAQPLTVAAGKVSGLLVDLNLPQTFVENSQGQLTGTVDWHFTARPLVPSSSTGYGNMDDLYGFVRSVTPTSPGTGFTSSFLLQTLSQSSGGQGPALNVDLTDQTKLIGQLVGVSRIDQLPTGSYVQVDGYVDENGNLVANAVQVEDRESLSQQLLGYVGQVLKVTRDSSGNVTQFNLLARETEPNDTTDIPTETVVTVNVSSFTSFNPYLVSSDLANLASSGNLALKPTTLAQGQEVVVHGVFTKPSSGPISVAANSVYPRLQSVQGTFSALVGQPGSDDKTGVFQMTPCSGILGNHPFMVATDAQTTFVNTSGLTSLSPTSPLLVRGLLFLDVNGSTINGISVPAGTLVLAAKQVRQF